MAPRARRARLRRLLPGRADTDDSLPEERTREQYRAWIMPLLELPVELILRTHGDPGNRRLLEQTLV